MIARERIVFLPGRLDAELAAAGATAEICVFGGAAMVLAFDALYHHDRIVPARTRYFVEEVLEDLWTDDPRP